MSELGRLRKVRNIRDIWPDEARDFTPWLALDENLSLLAETLDFGADGFEREGVEVNVGPFRADILCRDTNSADGDLVLIENQYGRTDHDHLGKLLTYASGLKVRSVILISEDLRLEHRAALAWLNEITNDEHRFFGVTVELWQIGDSLPAPKFNVIVAPNDWSKQVNARLAATTSDTQEFYLRYWQALGDRIAQSDTPLRSRKPLPQSWTGFGIGRSNFELNASIYSSKRKLKAELTLYGDDSKACLGLLQQSRTEIEQELGFQLDWDPMHDRKGARASITHGETDVGDVTLWPAQHDWLIRHLSAMHTVFHDRIRLLDAKDWNGVSA